MRNIYDNSEFFAAYAEMGRSKDGLKAAGEWHQLQPLFPKLQGKKVLDLGYIPCFMRFSGRRIAAPSVFACHSSQSDIGLFLSEFALQ